MRICRDGQVPCAEALRETKGIAKAPAPAAMKWRRSIFLDMILSRFRAGYCTRLALPSASGETDWRIRYGVGLGCGAEFVHRTRRSAPSAARRCVPHRVRDTRASPLDDLGPDVAQNGGLAWRQIGEAGLPAEFGDPALGGEGAQRLVDGLDQRAIAGKPDIAAIGADRIIIAGRRERRIGVRGAMGVEAREVDQR